MILQGSILVLFSFENHQLTSDESLGKNDAPICVVVRNFLHECGTDADNATVVTQFNRCFREAIVAQRAYCYISRTDGQSKLSEVTLCLKIGEHRAMFGVGKEVGCKNAPQSTSNLSNEGNFLETIFVC